MSYQHRAATMAPNALLWDREFWKVNRTFAISSLLGLVLIAIFYPLTYPRSSDPSAWLSVLIHPLVLWGLFIGVKALAKIEVDDAIARVVEGRVMVELGKIKGGLKDRIYLDHLDTDFLPHNPSHDKGMLRLFQYIIAEARDRKFHASAVLMEPLREEALGDLFRIQTIQKIAFQFGILGTFAGLIVAFSRMSLNGEDLLKPEALRQLFGALHICFSASVAGLEVAIVLAVVMMVVRTRQEAFFQDMETASAAMISLARNSINRDDFLVELEQVRAGMAQVSERVYAQSKEVESQTEAIRVGLTRLSDLKLDFNGFLARIHEEQLLTLGEMKSVYEVISPKRVAEDLKESLVAANRSLAASFKEEIDRSSAELGKINESLRLVKDLGVRMEEERAQQASILAESRRGLVWSASELAKAVQQIMRSQEDQLLRLTERLDAAPARAVPETVAGGGSEVTLGHLEKSFDRMARQLEKLSSGLERNNSTLREVIALHSFYQSWVSKPKEWLVAFRSLCSRRLRGAR